MRKRDKILIMKRFDKPVDDYDSVREYFHNGYQRAEVTIVNPHNPINGVSGRDKKNLITHKFRVFKHDQLQIDHDILWLDGFYPRLMRIMTVRQDPKSRRHMEVYCVEKAHGEDTIMNRTTYGESVY